MIRRANHLVCGEWYLLSRKSSLYENVNETNQQIEQLHKSSSQNLKF